LDTTLNGEDEELSLLSTIISEFEQEIDGFYSSGTDQYLRIGTLEGRAADELQLYSSGDIEEFVRSGGSVEAKYAIDILNKIADQTIELEDEDTQKIYDYLKEILQSNVEGQSVEYQKLLELFETLDKTIEDLNLSAPDLSDEMVKIQSEFDESVEDLLNQL
jgi:hypothetical protein